MLATQNARSLKLMLPVARGPWLLNAPTSKVNDAFLNMGNLKVKSNEKKFAALLNSG